MKKRERTIFRKILVPLISVLVFEVIFMTGSIVFGGTINKLNQNAIDMLVQQTENRGNYLLTEMINNWANLSMLSEEIDAKVQSSLKAGTLTLDDLNENSAACIALLRDLVPKFSGIMYSRQISGIFMILNTKGSEIESSQGIWLRDLDPIAMPSVKNADLLWERAPGEIVKSSYIATDSAWKPSFSKHDTIEQPFFYKPYQTAFDDVRGLDEKEYGYWTTKEFSLEGDNRTSVAYSVPLILNDGTVYGVLGIEILTDYLRRLLPKSELLDDNQGSYILAVKPENDMKLTPIVLSSDTLTMQEAEEMQFVLLENNINVESSVADKSYYGAAKRFKLYKNNAPFDMDNWYLLGVSSKESLFAFSAQILNLLYISAILAFIVGLVGILIASYSLSKPIKKLSDEVSKAQKDHTLPVLSSTGIREIDRFADSISRLGHEVVESSTRFLSILKMASVELAGYELQEETDSVYVTDNYFPLLGVHDVDTKNMTVKQFLELCEKLDKSLEHSDTENGSVVYKVSHSNGIVRYLRSEHQEKDGQRIGIIEDATEATLEKLRITKERDSDLLTGLHARRGFTREIDKLFEESKRLKHSGLLMIDLDNLKTTNDRYGHEFGDIYIRTAGNCFETNTPENTLCARLSGDEFVIFFHGYDSKDEIRQKVEDLYKAIREVKLDLPDDTKMGLSASGGLAWYPENSTNRSELMKYADFAMYQVKRSKKGEYKEFDPEVFRQSQQNIYSTV